MRALSETPPPGSIQESIRFWFLGCWLDVGGKQSRNHVFHVRRLVRRLLPYGVVLPSQTARLELRIAPDKKRLIEQAAKLSNTTLTAFVTETLVERARLLVEGPKLSTDSGTDDLRPIGGWSFELPDDWDAPLDDFADYR